MAEIKFEVPLEELSDDDLNEFLSDDEKREFIKCKDEVNGGLETCIDIAENPNDSPINVSIALSLLKFEVKSFVPMYQIRSLLKNVHLGCPRFWYHLE